MVVPFRHVPCLPALRARIRTRAHALAALALAAAAVVGPLHGAAQGTARVAGSPVAPAAPAPAPAPAPPPAPDFAGVPVSAEVRALALWALASGDAAGRFVVLVDKRQAHAFVLDPRGHLRGHAPVLLGLARGDDTVPGIGDRPLAQVRPQERTTPAGRFLPETGRNTHGEDVVWVDYAAAVSMHRVRAQVKAERRLQRLASPTPADNRISYGCINLPPAFYERVLLPAVRAAAVVYVLPEVRPLADVFPGLRPTGAAGSRRRVGPVGSLG